MNHGAGVGIRRVDAECDHLRQPRPVGSDWMAVKRNRPATHRARR